MFGRRPTGSRRKRVEGRLARTRGELATAQEIHGVNENVGELFDERHRDGPPSDPALRFGHNMTAGYIDRAIASSRRRVRGLERRERRLKGRLGAKD
ncbi:MAG: hypothetical protein NT067_00445 [Candidatus Diapherotrites archaeon]|nr:hypothetical protein [Candidatus Diapherotrites archaeon]